jgi:hypothetical protein
LLSIIVLSFCSLVQVIDKAKDIILSSS